MRNAAYGAVIVIGVVIGWETFAALHQGFMLRMRLAAMVNAVNRDDIDGATVIGRDVERLRERPPLSLFR